MRALAYQGPKNVSVDEVPDAAIERPTDALVRIATADICDSDLHMCEGRTDVEAGKALGHESMGEVIAVGAGKRIAFLVRARRGRPGIMVIIDAVEA